MSINLRSLAPLIVPVLLAGHGLRKRSLSPSGALAAFIVGSIMFFSPVWAFGISLIVFYLAGSRATKVGKGRKAKLEDGYEGNEAGYRTAWQVLCNSFTAAVACSAWSIAFLPFFPYDGQWCPLDANVAGGLSRALVFSIIGHFAACLGDTLASELGILDGNPPILITTLRTVPPGTNGGVSKLGTFFSGVGGQIMATTMYVVLILENSECRKMELLPAVSEALIWGWGAGIVGSLIDSLLGATVQRTRYSNERKRILTDDTVAKPGDDIKVISGWNILSNNQVNFVSSALTAVGLAVFSLYY